MVRTEIVEFEQAMHRQGIIEECVTCPPLCFALASYDAIYYHLFTKYSIGERVEAQQHSFMSSTKRCLLLPRRGAGQDLQDGAVRQNDGLRRRGARRQLLRVWDVLRVCPAEQTLHVVQVDTASGAGKADGGHELSLKGLIDPEAFKPDVWAMKRGETIDGVDGTVGRWRPWQSAWHARAAAAAAWLPWALGWAAISRHLSRR